MTAMDSSIPTQIAETIQTAHIKRHPSPQHDLNTSTAASRKEPVKLSSSRPENDEDADDSLTEDEDEDGDHDGIPHRFVWPTTRHQQLPPLPDLRFEQSYLHSIAGADTWWKVVWITFRDQMIMPLAQGVLYNLALCGWQHWNRNAQYSGSSIGARFRRWWYGVNKWPIPGKAEKSKFVK